MWHWIGHVLGLDDAASPFYLFWSGIMGGLGPLAGGLAVLRKHNCNRRWCFRVGRFYHGERAYCRKHHPHEAPDGPA